MNTDIKSPASRAEAVLFWFYVAGLAWVPFWFGSNDLLAWGINAVLFPALALVYEISRLAERRPHAVALRHAAPAVACFAVAAIAIVVQMATATPPSLHNALWGLTADALGKPVAGSISLNRDLTLQALVRLLTAASAFWLALQLGRDRVRANRLLAALAVICTAYAGLGLIVYATAPDTFLWLKPSSAPGFVSSTFYNRNNFATYAGIGIVILLGLLLKSYRNTSVMAGPLRRRIAALIEITGKAGALHAGALFVVLVALLLSGSRGGIMSMLFGAAVLVALTVGQSGKSAKGQRGVMIVIIVAVMVVFAAFGDSLIGRIRVQGLGDESRMAIYQLTTASIANSPLAGFGYGTFADVFPLFRDRSVDPGNIWLMAHNTYLEVFQGLGVVFGGLLVASVALIAVRCASGAILRQMNATVPSVAVAVASLIALNALVDFSLQIQAVTLTFMAILGAGLAQSASSRLTLSD